MNIFKKTILASALTAISYSSAYAGCGIEKGNVSILSNDFPALHVVAKGAEDCDGDGVTVSKNQTKEHREIQVAALTANPAQYTTAFIANSSIVPLLGANLIRPMDDLIAKYAPNLPASNKVVIDGKVMAIAFMANAQHLFVRTDILEKVGKEVPTTYEEVIDVAKAIRDAGIMEYPFAMNTKTGWNLGEEFINMHLGMGGKFFKDGSAEPAINNETGVKTLNMIKALTEYSNPDFLTFDSNATQAMWEAGNLAIGQFWGSRGAGILDDEGSSAEVIKATKLVAAPMVGGGKKPATSLWWDGFSIAANISAEDATATFIALMNGISDDMIKENNDTAVWISPVFKAGVSAEGVNATIKGGASPYPMLPYMGLMHSALGNELSEFLQGSESAEQALKDVEAAYVASAKDQGFLK